MNRIFKLLDTPKEQVKCLVVSNPSKNFVSMSYNGERLVWYWLDGKLITPGSEDGLVVSPLAARALIKEDIAHIMSMDGIDEVVYVDSNGNKTNGPYLLPDEVKNDPLADSKAEVLMTIYHDYIVNRFNLSEDVIVGCQKFGILKDFLTLVNL